ncbi:MAG: hypothetical protein IT546_08000 [Caulobacteraceae bacterium]|nr:hypothetical protein [Caulobacteraceae bacterium]
MKTIASLAAAAALLACAGQASAADPSVTLLGMAEGSCSLPDTWVFVTQTGGASAAQFSGMTWSIPTEAFATSSSEAVAGDEYSIRLRGLAFCNTSHSVLLSSTRGGLKNGLSAPPPPGFANRRAMRYEAQWSTEAVGSSSVGGLGPTVVLTPTGPAQAAIMDYIVSSSLPPPGVRGFDVQMSLQRDPIAEPLVAGAYSDTLTITLSVD